MAQVQYLGLDDFSFSLLAGKGLYRWDEDDIIVDPWCAERGNTPVLVDKFTGERFFARRLSDDALELALNMVRIPPEDADVCLWPSDVVHLSESSCGACSSFGIRDYRFIPDAAASYREDTCGASALLFREIDEEQALPLFEKLKRLEEQNHLSWESIEAQKLAIELMRAFNRLNQLGYCYLDVHFDRILVRSTKEVVFDFSLLTRRFLGNSSDNEAWGIGQIKERFPVEFTSPWIFNDENNSFGFEEQNYAIAGLLFFILLGWYPYRGKRHDEADFDTFNGRDSTYYFEEFAGYRKEYEFIFDPDGEDNKLGVKAAAHPITKRWDALPESVSELFNIAFIRHSDGKRKSELPCPTPATWLHAFKEAGWVTATQLEKWGITDESC